MAEGTAKLFLAATIRPKPEHYADARAALEAIVPLTLDEPGCHVFSAFESRDEDHTLHLFECFDDEAALEVHYTKTYTRDVFEAYKTWLRAPVDVKRLSALSAKTWQQFHD